MRPVFFLHIPKTAGSSVHKFLADLTGNFCFMEHGGQRSTPLPALFSRFTSAGGHVRMREIIADWDPFVVGFTVLRDPVDRFLSHYSFLRDPKQSVSDPFVRLARAHTVEELVEGTNPLAMYLANQQCWYLSTLPPFAPHEAHCASAINNLNFFQVIGFIESIDESLSKLATIVGVKQKPACPHLNKTGDRVRSESLPGRVIDRLKELTRFDQLLYEAAHRMEPTARASNPIRPLPFATLGARIPAIFGTRRALIDLVRVVHEESIVVGSRFTLAVEWHATHDVGSVVAGFAITNFIGQLVFGTNSENLGMPIVGEADRPAKIEFSVEANLEPGTYWIDVALHAAESSLCETFHWQEKATLFEVHPADASPYEGGANLRVYIESATGMSPLTPGPIGSIRLWVLDPPASVKLSSNFQLQLELFNGTTTVLGTRGTNPFHLGYKWVNAVTGEFSDAEGIRTALIPAQLEGKLSRRLLNIVSPPVPGRYRLLPRLVQEQVRWIEPPELWVNVEPIFEVEL